MLHYSTLEVLRRTGVAVKDPDAIEVFKKGGCFVDRERVRIPYEKWVNDGQKNLGMRANERVKEILESHIPDPLDKDVENKLMEIVQFRDRR